MCLSCLFYISPDAVRRRMAYWVSCGAVSQQEVNAHEGGIDLIYTLQDDQEVITYVLLLYIIINLPI